MAAAKAATKRSTTKTTKTTKKSTTKAPQNAARKSAPRAAKLAPAAKVVAPAATLAKPTSGYSGTPLAQKLGVKEGHRVVLLDAPEGFASTLEPLPPIALATSLRGSADVILFFCRARRDLERAIASLHTAIHPAGGLWIAWPKKASRLATDMTEDVVREVALPRGLVDNKVCAIDEIWSGLRVVIRKELRDQPR
jgi:hypothetical protein